MAKKAKKTTTPIAIIYTNKCCGYCGTTKEKFDEEKVEFIEKDTNDFSNEWNEVARLTGLPTFPTIKFNGNYYIPGRDFQNPEQIVEYIKNWNSENEIGQDINVRLLEAFKTLAFTLNRSLNRLQGDLQQLSQQEYTVTKAQVKKEWQPNPPHVNESTD